MASVEEVDHELLDELTNEEDEVSEDYGDILEEVLQNDKVTNTQTLKDVMADTQLLSQIRTTCEQIFGDINQIPAIGYPGRLVVFGDNAIPLYKSTFGTHSVFVAAADVGKGRLIIMSSPKMGKGFVSKNGKDQLAILHENILQWVSRCDREKCNNVEILDIETTQKIGKLSGENTVLFGSKIGKVLNKNDRILAFLRKGGGVVLAWNHLPWCKKNADSMKHGHPFFMGTGIGVADDKHFVGAKYVTINLNEDLYVNLTACHLGKWLTSCCDTSIEKMSDIANNLRNSLSDIPRYILESHRDKIAALFKRCHDHMGANAPDPDKPVKDPSKLGAIRILSVLTNVGFGYNKAPNVDKFPGDVESPVSLECVDIEIKPNGISEFHPTGYYLPPGEELVITVKNKNLLPGGWAVRVGAHSDKLYGKSSLKRWPSIVVRRSLSDKKETTIFSAYGGNIYINCPATKDEGHFEFKNVIQAPFFNLSDPVSVSSWEAVGRKAPGPWADMSGRHIRITLPSTAIREMIDPTLSMETWDRVMCCHLDLRGTDPNTHKKSWIVYDTQISRGGMHSGYPVMGHVSDSCNPKSEKFILSVDRLTTSGAWGPYHELGHNMQKGMWTFKGMIEVTCNIFTLHAIAVVAGKPVWELPKFKSPNRLRMYKQFFESGAPDSKKTAATGLGFYAQLAHHFGWNTYKTVFEEYEHLTVKERPVKNEDKIDQWLHRFSKHAGVNIAPVMEFWGIKFSEKAMSKIQYLKPFLPDDRLTKLDENRVKVVCEKYPDIIRELVA